MASSSLLLCTIDWRDPEEQGNDSTLFFALCWMVKQKHSWGSDASSGSVAAKSHSRSTYCCMQRNSFHHGVWAHVPMDHTVPCSTVHTTLHETAQNP